MKLRPVGCTIGLHGWVPPESGHRHLSQALDRMRDRSCWHTVPSRNSRLVQGINTNTKWSGASSFLPRFRIVAAVPTFAFADIYLVVCPVADVATFFGRLKAIGS